MQRRTRPSSIFVCTALAIGIASSHAALAAAPASESENKGIWEPANYSQDVKLYDVFFVSAQAGWVSGTGGTLLHTEDAGATWTAQLRTEERSSEGPIVNLRFVDETHGWAVDSGAGRLLRTTDGKTWQDVGSIPGRGDYTFVSEHDGVYVSGARIFKTQDGGHIWQQVFDCSNVNVEGGGREFGCGEFKSVGFATPSVGYAVAGGTPMRGAFALARTADGGTSWNLRIITTLGNAEALFFIDENTGFVSTLPDGRVYKTPDGGQTWTLVPGIVLKAGATIRFADPEVGWLIGGPNPLFYTTDSGHEWRAQTISFPANVNAFSLPRRDRGYVVGDHGMIYRYRVVPRTEQVADSVTAHGTALLDSPLEEYAAELHQEIEDLQEAATKERVGEDGGVEGANAVAEVPWASRHGQEMYKLQVTVETLSNEIPQFTRRHRNLNLVFAGSQLAGQMVGQTKSLNDNFSLLRDARDNQSAVDALDELAAQAEGLVESVRAASKAYEIDWETAAPVTPALEETNLTH